MSSIRFEDTRWPLAVITFEGEPSDADFDGYLATLARYIGRADRERIRYGCVLDATTVTGLSASQRKRMGDWMRTHAVETERACAGIAFVISSGVVRGLLTAIFWLAPMPTAHTVVATRAEAERWVLGRVSDSQGAGDHSDAVGTPPAVVRRGCFAQRRSRSSTSKRGSRSGE